MYEQDGALPARPACSAWADPHPLQIPSGEGRGVAPRELARQRGERECRATGARFRLGAKQRCWAARPPWRAPPVLRRRRRPSRRRVARRVRQKAGRGGRSPRRPRPRQPRRPRQRRVRPRWTPPRSNSSRRRRWCPTRPPRRLPRQPRRPKQRRVPPRWTLRRRRRLLAPRRTRRGSLQGHCWRPLPQAWRRSGQPYTRREAVGAVVAAVRGNRGSRRRRARHRRSGLLLRLLLCLLRPPLRRLLRSPRQSQSPRLL